MAPALTERHRGHEDRALHRDDSRPLLGHREFNSEAVWSHCTDAQFRVTMVPQSSGHDTSRCRPVATCGDRACYDTRITPGMRIPRLSIRLWSTFRSVTPGDTM